MSQTDDQPVPLSATEAETPFLRNLKFGGVLVLGMALAALVVWFVVKSGDAALRPVTQSAVQTPVVDAIGLSQFQAVEDKFEHLDNRVGELATRLEKLEQVSLTATPSGAGATEATSADNTKLKEDVAALSTTLGDIQNQLRLAAQAADKNHFADQATLAAVVALMQLRVLADRGEGFTPEYTTLALATAQNAPLHDFVAKLEPLAAEGAPSLALLREEFSGLHHAARAAVIHAEAKDWIDRVLAALRSLVSIRSLYPEGGGEIGLEAVQADLAQHRLAAALEKVDALPEAARDLLKTWRARVEARRKLDESLKAIAAMLATPVGAQ